MTAPDNAVSRDQKHERILAAVLRLERSPSAFNTAEIRTIAAEAHEWMRTLMCDLRGHETALTTAERDRDAALKSASDGWRAAGEAQGKLEASETAGVVEGWRRRAEEAERLAEERLEALRPFVLSHTRIFLTSRERMHPTGVAIYDEAVDKARALTAAAEGTGDV